MNSYAHVTQNVSSISGSSIGGLIGFSVGGISNSYSYVGGNVYSPAGYSGGLAGYASGTIENSFAKVNGNVTAGSEYAGGLVGDSWGRVSNSYADVQGTLEANSHVGGLVGFAHSEVSDSSSKVGGDVISRDSGYVGGLVGRAAENITNSNASVIGLVKGDGLTGALIGRFENNSRLVRNSHANISGAVIRRATPLLILIGASPVITIENSYFSIAGNSYPVVPADGSVTSSDVVFELISSSPSMTYTQDYEWSIDPLPSFLELPTFPSLLGTLNRSISPEIFGTDACLNNGKPHLIALSNSFTNSCTTSGNDEVVRERRYREVVEVRFATKIEKTLGFKNESQLPKNAAISFIEGTEKIDLAKVKAVEISPTANVRVSAKTGEALQISLKSESKEPVELWVKSPDGSWLLAGVITFDKDGKAILPPLQFKNVGDYTLVLNKPSADSAKGSTPLNQSGSVLVAVS